MTEDALARVSAHIEAKPGWSADQVGPGKGAALHKVMGKMFAILSVGKTGRYLNVKCDPHLVEILKEQYEGVGHRGHLDRRFWIAIDLGADVPLGEILRLIDGSYDLIVAALTRKQRAQLASEASLS